MADNRESTITKGMALAVAYAAFYYGLRYISFNQWFLPAGLRVACLLFFPYRYWPYLFLGEAGLTLSQKLNMAGDYGYPWAIFSSILLAPLSSLAPLVVRKRLPTVDAIAQWLPLVILPVATWSAISKTTLNYALFGPKQPEDFHAFVNYFVGDYLGIMMALVPYLLWTRRKRDAFSLHNTMRDTVIAAIMIGGLYGILEWHPPDENMLRLSMLMLMTTPAMFLTFFHGWRGAAIGVVMANFGVAQAMTYSGIRDAHDDVVFYTQLGLVLFSIILLLFGSRITMHYENARRSGIDKQQALKLARAHMLSSDPAVRDQLITVASMHTVVDSARHQLAKSMADNGMHQEALDLNAQGVIHRQIFEEQALALYPIGIELHGLYGVIDTPVFRESRASGIDVEMQFGATDPRTLSTELQVLAYRCLFQAIDQLSDWEPEHYHLSLRVWRGRERRGIYLSIRVTASAPLERTPYGEKAAQLLEAYVRTHDGIARQTPKHVCVLLSEPNTVPSAQAQMPTPP